MTEDEDYKLVPVDVGNEQAWEIRILSGEFTETVLRFGNVSIDGPNDAIKFNFDITTSPDPDLTVLNDDLQSFAADVLGDLIENSLERGSILLDDK
jgi:ligand-binding SRPBCC domain-containing protein